jgi:hypothetical protein
MRSFTTIALGGALCVGAFLAARHWTQPTASTSATAVVSPLSVPETRPSKDEKAPNLTSPDALARLRALLTKLPEATLADLPTIWKAAALDPMLQRAVVVRWIELSPANCLQQMLADPQGASFCSLLFNQWARLNAGDAMAAASKVVDRPRFTSATRDVIHGVLTIDLKQAVAMTRNAPALQGSIGVLPSVFTPNYADFLLATMPEPLPNPWEPSIKVCWESWLKADASGSSAWLGKYPEYRARLLPLATKVMATAAPLETIQAASQMPPGPERNKAIYVALRTWAAQAPDAALTWLDKTDLPERPHLAEAILAEAKTSALPSVAKAVDSMSLGQTHDAAMKQLAIKWAQSSPKAAWAWLAASADEAGKWDAAKMIVPYVANQDFSDAVKMVTQGPSEYQRRAQDFFCRAMISAERDKLLAFGKTLPRAQQERFFPTYFSELSRRSTLAEGYQRLMQVPDPTMRPALMRDLLHHYTGTQGVEIEEAIAWANSLADPKLRAAAGKVLRDPENMPKDKLRVVEEKLNQ